MNLSMLLEMTAEGAPDRVILGSRNSGLTTSELLRRARRAGHEFRRRGVERVAMLDVNSEAVPITLLGAAAAGLPFAPVNYRLTDVQLESIMKRVAPAVVVVAPEMAERVPDVDGLDVIARDDVLASVAEPGEADELDFVDPESVAILLFTSGTTGEPKAAVLRHRHLAAYVINTVEFLSADESDAQLISVPAYHVAGMSVVLSCIYAGRRIVYLPEFDAERWLELATEESITQAMVVPTMLRRILRAMEVSDRTPESLRHLSYGGGRMTRDVIEHAMQLLPHVDYVNAYGLTETSSTLSVLSPDEHREAAASDDAEVRRRLGSVGRPLPAIDLEIRDADGRMCALGEVGEICVRGEQVAGEYADRSALTDEGWFRTNDAGFIDEHGFLYLDGRLDDVIVRGAENLSPGEIEDTLVEHPAVAEAGVVGIPHPEWGEAVAAVVVLADDASATEAELQEWVRARLRSTKTPQVIQFRDELPYNETGKLLRRVLRDEMSA